MSMNITDIKDSLKRRKQFFISFEEEFYRKFEEELSKFSYDKEIKEKLILLKNKIFNRIFISPKENTEDIYNIAYLFAKDDIDVRDLLRVLFVYSVKSFADYLLKTKPSIKDVYFFSTMLDIYYSEVEKAYLDYEKLKEKEAVKSTGTDREKYEEEFILEILKRHRGETFTAISYYKEVPITFKLKLIKTTDKYIVMDLSKTTINISKLTGPVYLKIPYLERPVKTHILNVNFKDSLLVLETPRLTDIPAEKRKDIRVMLSEPIKVIVKKDNEETMGLIVDISSRGVKFFTGRLGSLKEGDKITLNFVLDGNNIKTQGNIKSIKKSSKGSFVGVQLLPDMKTENIISDFVMKRQFEVLKELRV